MKWSKYNYMFKSERYGYLLYNSLSNSFVELDEDSFGELKRVKADPQGYDFDNAPGLKKKLLQAKVLVDNDLDEFYRLKLTRHLKRYDRSGMSLTIAPTLHCNLNCRYCYEAARPPVYMDDLTEKRLIRFVKGFPDLKRLFVTWYGGEALLAFPRIESLTPKLRRLVGDYSAALITNGYLLDESKIRELARLAIVKVHMTIDGPAAVHNRRRPHSQNKDSYARIMRNLDALMAHNASPGKKGKPQVIIRINVDKSNEDHYASTYKRLQSRYPGQQITIYPGFIKQGLAACNSTSEELLDRQMQAEFNLRQFKENRIIGSGFFPSLCTQECMARHLDSFLIDPRGDLYKCWTDIGVKDKSIGNIARRGQLNDALLSRYLTGADPFDEPQCQNCFHLPICEGRCPYYALKNKFEAGTFDICPLSKGNLKEFLETHYQAIKQL